MVVVPVTLPLRLAIVVPVQTKISVPASTTGLINTYTLDPSDTALSPLQFYLTSFGSGTCFEITDTMSVFISGIPNAEFVWSNACENQNALFNDTSTVSPGTITGWIWDFGNGDTSSLENPSPVYTTTGDYTVTLIVETSGGCTDSVSHIIHIKNITYGIYATQTIYYCKHNSIISARNISVNGILAR